MLNFAGRVAVITGAGGGLGKQYALTLSERGAAVVVNDLGVDRSGKGKSSSAADSVVQEIRKRGGKAIPDYNSVEEGEKIIATALNNFGRIDILINNAGILRDKSFLNMSVDEWDIVHQIHMKGAFTVTKAAWPHFRKQKYGRIIMTSSSAGIYGNFGQANYSSAKLGLVGLCKTLAVEGAKYGIQCNTMIPVAASRLTEDVLPKELFDQFKPEFVSPVVTWLCHETCPENGEVFEAAGGWVGKFKWYRSLGKTFPVSDFTPEAVRDNWSLISNMSDATSPATVQEEMAELVEALSGGFGARHVSDGSVAKYTYTPDTAILYALGVGVSSQQPDHLKFLYEGSENFSVLPTFGILAGTAAVFDFAAFQEEMQRLNADPTKFLHGEQYMELYQPLPSSGTLFSTCKIVDVVDKGSGAVVICDVDTLNDKGEKVIYSQWVVFMVGAGNFGGKRNSDKIIPITSAPNRTPDAVIKEKTSIDQAALYRLCGDKNPVHIDPTFASLGGHSKPIMHGLCTYGYAARHVLQHYCENDVKRFKAIKARFSRPIDPGQTIQTEMWKEGQRIYFQCTVAETGKPLLSGGYVDLQNGSPTITSKPSTTLKSDAIFLEIGRRLTGMPTLAPSIRELYQWNILKNGETAAQWIVDLKNGQGSVYRGTATNEKPGCTLTLEDDVAVALASGQIDPQKAFMAGKIKINGNIFLADKLQPLLNGRRNNQSSKSPSNGDNNPKDNPPLKSEAIFLEMKNNIKNNPDVVKRVGKVYQWNITKDGKQAAQWTLDLKNDKGDCFKGTPKTGKADCTLIMEDDLFADISNGRVDPQKAFMSGKLKLQGNILASQKLQDVWKSSPQASAAKQVSSVPQSQQPSSQATSPLAEKLSHYKADMVFQIFADRLHEEPEIAKKVKVIYHWNILCNKKKVTEWTIDLKTGTGSIYKGAPKSKPDVTLTMEDEDMVLLMLGKLNPQKAFMTGRLKVKGNIMLTQKLNQLWQEILKSKRATEMPVLSTVLADKPMDSSLKSEGYFVLFGRKISKIPKLQSKVGAIFEVNITKNKQPAKQWTIDLKSKAISVYRGPTKAAEANCKISIDDEVFSSWVAGILPGQRVLDGNLVTVTGDKASAQKLFGILSSQSKL